MRTVTASWVASVLPPRPLDANKGTFGRLLVIGGCERYRGAPVLAGLAAYRVGCGIVTLCVDPACSPTAGCWLPEATHLPFSLPVDATGITAVVLGPGMGDSPLLAPYLADPLPLSHVLDADALNYLSSLPSWLPRLEEQAQNRQVILTPHPGEMARLCGLSVAEVQANRAKLAQQKAQEWRCVVVLKGANTIIACPTDCAQLEGAIPALAVAGTGDVLAGVIGGLLAQGMPPFDAACAGAFLHAQAGQRWSDRHGDRGLLAHELTDYLLAP